MEINVPKLLTFFDERPAGSKGHATGIVAFMGEDLAFGLLIRYLREHWDPSTERLHGPCTTGQRKGPRLDGWIRTHRDGAGLLLQVEVKNWSAHAIGGEVLPRNADPQTVQNYKLKRWKEQWNDDDSTFKNDGVRKVLKPMRRPPGYERWPVEPAVCFWYAIHRMGGDEPLFSVPVHESEFDQVWVFSMSSYLRSLSQTRIDIEMPNVEARLDWIRQFLR